MRLALAIGMIVAAAGPARADDIPFEEISEPQETHRREVFEPHRELFASGAFVMSRVEDAMPERTRRHAFATAGIRAYGEDFSSVSLAVATDGDRVGLLGGGELHRWLGARIYLDAGIGVGAFLVNGRAVLATARLGLAYYASRRLVVRLGPEGVFAIANDGASSLGAGLGLGFGYLY